MTDWVCVRCGTRNDIEEICGKCGMDFDDCVKETYNRGNGDPDWK